ncbi:MAG: hypothetical protein EBT15_10965 [Betaproteobacteria bacterium]|nr:hypothetical protein [Betaproteobacteria bacterium]
MDESEARAWYLRRLTRIAERLPNGLLHRLVDDAQFFYDWNLRKRHARASSRLAQHKAWEAKAEEKYWKGVRR